MKTQGQKIKELRTSLKMTQETLAENLGISIKSIQRYETDKSKTDTYSLKKIAKFCDVSADYLLGLLTFEGEFREGSNNSLQNEKNNVFYSHYLRCKKSTDIDAYSEYYWIYYEKNKIIGGQTAWSGWLDETHVLEVRKLRPVIPIKAIEVCTKKYDDRPMLVNNEKDAIIFQIFGGNAIIKKEICEQCLPEFLENFISDPKKLLV